METIIERTPGRITVSMSTRRWNRIQKLEQAYKLARIIKHSMEQAEKAPAMTVEQAIKHLEELGSRRYAFPMSSTAKILTLEKTQENLGFLLAKS
jgi:16S rRNA U1498 N3-methylase RsmE